MFLTLRYNFLQGFLAGIGRVMDGYWMGIGQVLCRYRTSILVALNCRMGTKRIPIHRPELKLRIGFDVSMICRRLKVYSCEHRAEPPSITIECCGRCFAILILQQGSSPN